MALAFPANPTTGQRYQNWIFDGVKWVVQASTLAEAPATPVGYARDGASGLWVPESPNHNKLINGFMEIDQANEGAVVTANGTYNVDGWSTIWSSTGLAVSSQRVADAPVGYSYSTRMTVTTVGTLATSSYLSFLTKIEGSDLQDTLFGTAGALPLTMSLWIKSSIAGTYGVGILNAASSRCYVFPLVVAAANTWQLFQVTIPGDVVGPWVTNGNTAAMSIWISASCGSGMQTAPNVWTAGGILGPTGMTNTVITTSGATFQLGPCKLEVGSKATPMLRQSFQQELARCQRYYEKSYAPGTAIGTGSIQGHGSIFYASFTTGQSNAAGNSAVFRVTKRSIPTVTLYSSQTGTSGTVRDSFNNADVTGNINGSGQNAFMWSASPSSVQAVIYLQAMWVADARL